MESTEPQLDAELVHGIVRRAGAPGFERFRAQLRSSGSAPGRSGYAARSAPAKVSASGPQLLRDDPEAAKGASPRLYIKVAEYQARGLVHLHVAIRIDRAMGARTTDPRVVLALIDGPYLGR